MHCSLTLPEHTPYHGVFTIHVSLTDISNCIDDMIKQCLSTSV